MKLICSAGHEMDTSKLSLAPGWSSYKKPGDKCGQLISYDVMDGSEYCQRRLRLSEKITVKETIDYCRVDVELEQELGEMARSGVPIILPAVKDKPRLSLRLNWDQREYSLVGDF